MNAWWIVAVLLAASGVTVWLYTLDRRVEKLEKKLRDIDDIDDALTALADVVRGHEVGLRAKGVIQ